MAINMVNPMLMQMATMNPLSSFMDAYHQARMNQYAREMSPLQLESQRLANQYYAPNIQSEIGLRNANANQLNTMTPIQAQKMRLENQYYAPNIESEIAFRNANVNHLNTMTPLQARQLMLENQFYPEKTQAAINAQNALSNFRAMGGGTGGVGSQQIIGLKRQIMADHPNWDINTINDAASAYIEGRDILSSGEKLPPPSGLAGQYLDLLAKQGTTSPIITQNIRSNQAEKEIDVLNKFAQEGIGDMGDTYFGYSPKAIMASFKNDEKSQKSLGKFIAAQALQYEIAQQRNKLANGPVGINATHELLSASQQRIKDYYPRLSSSAKEESSRYLNEALKEGNKARQSVSARSSKNVGKKEQSEKTASLRYNPQTGQLEEI